MKGPSLLPLIFLLLPLLGLATPRSSSRSVRSPVVSSGSLTGGHIGLECKTCHVDPHKPEIDVTICKTCHSDEWDIVQAGKHKGGVAPFERYCTTCHDPHHPEYLWNLTKQDWMKHTEDYSALCSQCHVFSPEEPLATPHNPVREVKPLIPPTMVIPITAAIAMIITLIGAAAIWKLPTKPKPT